jgi:alginate O-acetyltransferase complex protein AlgI
MVFSSSLFLLYFLPIFLIVYHIVPHKLRNWVILAASIFFYSWGAPKFVFVVIGVVTADFYIVKFMHKQQIALNKKWLLSLSILLKLGLLLYFKYANFFVDNFNSVLHSFGFENIHWTKVILPIGISFFTFQAITYSVDVYRKVREPLKKVTDYLVYIMLFPQMIAGPIVRFNTIAEQIEDRKHLETFDNKLLGFFRFAIGLAKKVLIANVMGEEADRIFAMTDAELTTPLAWMGAIAYTFQIYFDFAGYSDMAIGIGRILGFKFPENFDNPYVAKSIKEFWKRWHMTLSAFFMNYLFLPLAYSFSRKLEKNKYWGIKTDMIIYLFAASITFILCGFWHGAAWNFIFWGMLHGFFLIIERLGLEKRLKKTWKPIQHFYTLFVLLISWVLFRVESFTQLQYYFKTMFSMKLNGEMYFFDSKYYVMLAIAILFSFITIVKPGKILEQKVFYNDYNKTGVIAMSVIVFFLLMISIGSITSSGFNPFIYFRF